MDRARSALFGPRTRRMIAASLQRGAPLPYLLGTRRGLAACASARGTFAILALDHRQNLRRELHPEDPAATTYAEMVDFKRAVVRALAATATGTLLDPEIGAAQCIADGSLPAAAGLIVAIEATGYEGPAGARVSRVLPGWSVAAGQADGRIGGEASRVLPPGCGERGRPGAARGHGGGRLQGSGPGALRGAAFVRPRDRREAGRRSPPTLCRRDRPATDGARRRRPEGRVSVRPGRDRRGGLGRRLRRAGRGVSGALGPPLRRRRRRDLRPAGGRRLPRRGIRRARGALRLGSGGDAAAGRAGRVAGD